jgi:MFS family permease
MERGLNPADDVDEREPDADLDPAAEPDADLDPADAADELEADDDLRTSADSRQRCDVRLLFAARFVRQLSFGAVGLVLLLLLAELKFDGHAVGTLFTLVFVGDTIISLYLTTNADRLSRRATLVVGSALAVFAAIAFSTTSSFTLLAIAGTIGVVSPAGGDVGPFTPVEQAVLADLSSGGGGVADLASTFGRYQFVGDLAKALGAALAGVLIDFARASGASELSALRLPMILFGVAGALKMVLYCALSSKVEADGWPHNALGSKRLVYCDRRLGLTRQGSRLIVLKLSVLFAVDSFAGGFIMFSFLAYWYRVRWGLSFASLGGMLGAISVVSGASGLAAGWMVARFGAVETMVYTHLPSNVLLMFVPLMPTRETAMAMLVVRNCISQMDVPARQAYVQSCVASDERSAAGGVTSLARTVGLAVSPLLLGALLGDTGADGSADVALQGVGGTLIDAPFYIAGSLKIAYDLAVWWGFRSSGTTSAADGSLRTAGAAA